MGALDAAVERRLAGLKLPLAVALPGGRRFGPARAAVTLRLARLSSLAHLATGQVGRVGEDYVEGRLDIDGALRDIDGHRRADDRRGSDAGRRPRRAAGVVARTDAHRALAPPPPAAGRRAAGAVPLRRVGRLLRAVAGPAACVLLRLLPRRRHDARAGAGGQARPHLPQADAARGRALPRHRRRLGRAAAVGGRALRRARARHHASRQPACAREPADRGARPARPRRDAAARLPRAARGRTLRQDRLGGHVRACRPRAAAAVLRQDPPPARARAGC